MEQVPPRKKRGRPAGTTKEKGPGKKRCGRGWRHGDAKKGQTGADKTGGCHRPSSTALVTVHRPQRKAAQQAQKQMDADSARALRQAGYEKAVGGKARRMAIAFQFVGVLDAPAPEDWHSERVTDRSGNNGWASGTIVLIASALHINPKHACKYIVPVLVRVNLCAELGIEYDGHVDAHKRYYVKN